MQNSSELRDKLQKILKINNMDLKKGAAKKTSVIKL